MPAENVDLIQQIAAGKLGPAAAPAPDAAAAAAAAQAQAQAQPPAAPKADPSPTEMERAQAKVAPTAEGDKGQEEAVRMLKIGDSEYTEQQITGTLGRYKDLNYKWQTEVAPHKPILEIARQLAEAAKKAGHNPTGEEIAALVKASIQAYTKNPQMGGKGGKADNDGDEGKGAKAAMSGDDDGDEAFAAWERDNAVKLPPGFRDMAKQNKALGSQMNQMMGMLQQMLQGGAAGQQAQAQGQQAMQQAQGMQVDAATRLIGTNLAGSFAKAGLPDDEGARADFRMFAQQRGYDLSDFLDPELTATVVADYKANKDAPEIARLRAIAQKRAAFTGNVEGAPGSGAAAGSPQAPADPMLAKLTSAAMGQRGL